ncbi:MAG: S8 family serine peptidase [Pseudomarimonas sp.]
MTNSRTPLSLAIAAIIFGAGLNAAPVNAQSMTATTSPRVVETSVDADQALQDRVNVFVQLIDEPAASVFVAERDRFVATNRFLFAGSPEDLKAAAERQAADAAMLRSEQLQVSQQVVIQALVNQFDAQVLFNARFAENGIAVRVPQSAIAGLTTIAGVKNVSLLATHETQAVSSIDFTGARSFWGTVAPDLNLRGADIGVGVIDSGIDHMHTEFAGPGGAAGYAPNATTTITPYPPAGATAAHFPTPKVIWGYDFVGDAYNAAGTTDAALIPLPDNNTMDTGGHGTSVASLIGGIGVNNDGTTYAGAHDRTQPNILTDLRISPGYAPASSLYAFRVFGTAGSSAVVASALDAATAVYIWQANPSNPWAAVGTIVGTVTNAAGQAQTVTYTMPQPPQTPRLRVINLSLGSNSGDIEEASSAAAQRAADAGLIVVLSAGNADDTYYITGSPGVAAGGISVAASFNDQFPGGLANAPVNGGQPALANFAITQFGTAVFSSVANSLSLTDAVWARPNLAENLAAAPVGYTPPIVQPPTVPPVNDLSPLVTLLDGVGQPINLFNVDGSNNLIVTMNPAVTNNPYSGKVVLVDRGSVGFHQKALAASRAGAAGVVIVNSTAAFGNMAANVNLPNVPIPVVMVTQAVGGLFASGGALNTGVSRTVDARPGLQVSMSPTNRGAQDTMAAYSSRGPRRVDEGIKPDITAPAENVTVATVNTGNGVSSFNGTSSAAPHTAGAMALLYNLHPTWSNYELKSLLLNSVANNVFTTVGPDILTPPSGQIWGVTRQGVGRWDLSRYANGGNSVIMFGADPAPTDGGANRNGTVNVSFGVFDVLGTVTQDRTITLRNKSGVAQNFSLAFRPVTETPGVSFSFPNGAAVSVPANGEITFPVRITANAANMRHARDLSLRPFQFINALGDANRRPRQFMNEASGFVELIPTARSLPLSTHRLSVQAFPRRASDLALTATPAPNPGTPRTFPFTGVGYNTGANTAFVDLTNFSFPSTPVDIVSFAKGFELSYIGDPTPGLSTSQRGADISHVGITSDFALRGTPFDEAAANNQSTVLVFAVAAQGQFDSPESGFGDEYQIDIDSNRDGTTDRMIRQFNFVNGERTTVRTNIMLPVVSSAPPFTTGTTTGFNLNILSNVYTNLFNNSVLTIPVQVSGGAGSLGLTAATANFRYRVRGTHRGVQVSQTPWLDYNVTTPGISFPGLSEPSWSTPFTSAQALSNLTVLTNETGMQANATRGLLMIFPMNAAGDRTQVDTAGFRSIGIMKNGFE